MGLLAAVLAQAPWVAAGERVRDASGADPASTTVSDADASRKPEEAATTQGAVPAQTSAPAPEGTPAAPKPSDPFAFADFTWLNGSPRQKKPAFDSDVFTLEMRADINYVHTSNSPADHTLSGSAELARSSEVQLQQLGVGGDFHYHNVRARLMTQFGVYSQLTPRNDPSPSRGQFNLADMYRYLSEAYGGYHIDKMHGINIDAGIFMSYIGLFSYYNYDNWTYQPSYVSANTPWFFQGIRLQFFPSDKLKIEPWIINGWQSYGMFNSRPGLGGQIMWRPNGSVSVVLNNYTGKDVLGNPDRSRFHTDDSLTVKYYDRPDATVSKAAFSLTADFGCEWGGGVKCTGGNAATPSQYFAGWMLYNRLWFDHDKYAFVVGGGQMTNPGRYLAILPPVNGATASTGTPYFTENPGDSLKAWDVSATFQYMPKEEITFLAEWGYRHANIPYFAGPGGLTPPGGNTGTPAIPVPGWTPDLVNSEGRVNFAIMVKF
jgi:hypothetical protein